MYRDMRCGKCDRLLGKVAGNAEIVCPRCNSLNKYDFEKNKITFETRLRKQSERKTLSGKRFE
jgi:phage FluMu protein Com